jgi:peptidoglycan hydrolase-like protein with peptidoglycan-binding domain
MVAIALTFFLQSGNVEAASLLRVGSGGSEVVFLQERLRSLGYGVDVDGKTPGKPQKHFRLTTDLSSMEL